MKKNLKIKRHFKGGIALALAVILIAVICVYSSDAYLRATDNPEQTDAVQESNVETDTVVPVDVSEEDFTADVSNEESEVFEDNDSNEENYDSEEDGFVEEDDSDEDISDGSGDDSEEDSFNEEGDGTEGDVMNETEPGETETEEQAPEKEETKPDEKEEVERSVKVTSSLGNAGVVEKGKLLVLTAHLTGFDDVDYEIQWQQSEDGTNWDDISGENGTKYTVTLTEDNEGYLWRASVSISES